MFDGEISSDEEVQVEVENDANDEKPHGGKQSKRKIPEKVDPPDEAKYAEEKSFLERKIDDVTKVIEGISREVDKKSNLRTQLRNEKKSIQESFEDAKVKREETNELLAKHNKFLDDVEQSRAMVRAQVKSYKQGLKFTDLTAANAAIQKLEYALTTENFPIAKQQKLINDLNMLKAQMPQIAIYAEQRNIAEMNKVDVSETLKQKAAATKLLAQMRKDNASNYEKIKKTRQQENAVNKEIEKLIKERKEQNNQRYMIQQESNALTKSYNDQKWFRDCFHA